MKNIKFDFKQLAEELHKHVQKRPKQFRSVHVYSVGSVFTADLVDMNAVIKHNDGYRYILVVLDVASRYAWAEPVKKKNKTDVSEAFEKIFKKSGIPKYLWVDKGSEFYNDKFLEILKQHKVKIYSTFNEGKGVIIERFNRTLKGWMWKDFTANNSHEWIGILQDLIKRYNEKVHKGIGATPESVFNQEEGVSIHKQKNNQDKPMFKVGDRVRLSVNKLHFEKSYTPKWTMEIFKIAKVLSTIPVTYKIDDLNGEEIKGTFYENELQLTKMPDIYLVDKELKKRTLNGVKQVLVHWLGYRKEADSWINASDLVDV